MFDSERAIDVEWSADKDGSTMFDVKLLLDVENQQGLLAKIVSAISGEQTDIKNVEAQTNESRDARISLVLSVADRKQMERVIGRIRRIKGVYEVERILR